jgi:death-on-curing protein
MEIYFLTLADVKMIHADQIRRYGGMQGIRDINLLDSALNYPQATFDQQYVHPDIYHMAAAYAFSLIKNHPFLDGNKRTGILVALLFLAYNDINLNANQEELYDLTMQIAESKISEEDIALFFKNKSSHNA